MNFTAIVFGATGETGKELTRALSESASFSRIVVVGRKSLFHNEKETKVSQIIIQDVSDFSKHVNCKIHAAFCCIGTSLTKVSMDVFRYVEKDLVVAIARQLHNLDCKHFHFVSGFMSHPTSKFFIPRVKGECEQLLMKVGFSSLIIYRPGLLRCKRQETRWLEGLGRRLSEWLDAGDWWSISTEKLANAMVHFAEQKLQEKLVGADTVCILEHHQIVNEQL